jgi:hypothetical protein
VPNRTTPAGLQTPNTPAPSAAANGVAGGWIGYSESTTSSGLITAKTDLTSIGLAVSVTVNPSRRIKISASARCDYNNAAGDRMILYIMEGAVDLKLIRVPASGFATNPITVFGQHPLTPSAGSHTYKLSLERVGANSVQVLHASDERAFILVEDIGPA